MATSWSFGPFGCMGLWSNVKFSPSKRRPQVYVIKKDLDVFSIGSVEIDFQVEDKSRCDPDCKANPLWYYSGHPSKIISFHCLKSKSGSLVSFDKPFS